MIAILGLKRVAVLLALAVLTALLGAIVFLYLEPQMTKTERALSSSKSAESKVRNDLADIEEEFLRLETQRDEFEQLQAQGFFSNQSRRDAESVFLAAKTASGVNDAVVTVRPGRVVENEVAANASQVLLESEIDIKLSGIDDTDLLAYVSYLEKYFPGHLMINSFSVARKSNISDTILRAIASGSNPGLVEGDLKMTWRTMVSRDEYLSAPQNNNEGGTF
jgi:hypothetical protein